MSVLRGISNSERREARPISRMGGERNLAAGQAALAIASLTAWVTASKASMVDAWRAG